MTAVQPEALQKNIERLQSPGSSKSAQESTLSSGSTNNNSSLGSGSGYRGPSPSSFHLSPKPNLPPSNATASGTSGVGSSSSPHLIAFPKLAQQGEHHSYSHTLSPSPVANHQHPYLSQLNGLSNNGNSRTAGGGGQQQQQGGVGIGGTTGRQPWTPSTDPLLDSQGSSVGSPAGLATAGGSLGSGLITPVHQRLSHIIGELVGKFLLEFEAYRPSIAEQPCTDADASLCIQAMPTSEARTNLDALYRMTSQLHASIQGVKQQQRQVAMAAANKAAAGSRSGGLPQHLNGGGSVTSPGYTPTAFHLNRTSSSGTVSAAGSLSNRLLPSFTSPQDLPMVLLNNSSGDTAATSSTTIHHHYNTSSSNNPLGATLTSANGSSVKEDSSTTTAGGNSSFTFNPNLITLLRSSATSLTVGGPSSSLAGGIGSGGDSSSLADTSNNVQLSSGTSSILHHSDVISGGGTTISVSGPCSPSSAAVTNPGSVPAGEFLKPFATYNKMENSMHAASVASLSGMLAPSPVKSTVTADVTRGGDCDDDAFEVNQYSVLRELGRGTQGRVFLAYDNVIREFRAIKSLRRGLSGSAVTEKFKQEVQIMKRMRHSNIVTLYEVIDDPKSTHIYLVMQYVEKGPLVKWTDKDRSRCEMIDSWRFQYFARQICAGLSYLHRRKIYHRDIKPENILLGNDDHVFLADFGVASMAREHPRSTSLSSAQSSKLGTPGMTHQPAAAIGGGLGSLSGTNHYLRSEDQLSLLCASGQFRLLPSLSPSGGGRQTSPMGGEEIGGAAPPAGLGPAGQGLIPSAQCSMVTMELGEHHVEGTPAYFAPEIIKCTGEDATQLDQTAIDVWALGVTCYQLLTGKLPFLPDSRATTARSVNEQDAPKKVKRSESEELDPMSSSCDTQGTMPPVDDESQPAGSAGSAESATPPSLTILRRTGSSALSLPSLPQVVEEVQQPDWDKCSLNTYPPEWWPYLSAVVEEPFPFLTDEWEQRYNSIVGGGSCTARSNDSIGTSSSSTDRRISAPPAPLAASRASTTGILNIDKLPTPKPAGTGRPGTSQVEIKNASASNSTATTSGMSNNHSPSSSSPQRWISPVPREWFLVLRGMLRKDPKKRWTLEQARSSIKEMGTLQNESFEMRGASSPNTTPRLRGARKAVSTAVQVMGGSEVRSTGGSGTTSPTASHQIPSDLVQSFECDPDSPWHRTSTTPLVGEGSNLSVTLVGESSLPGGGSGGGQRMMRPPAVSGGTAPPTPNERSPVNPPL